MTQDATGKRPRVSLTFPERISPTQLTAKNVAELTLPAGKNDVIFFDTELAGFGYRLRAGAGGKTLRSWVTQYRRAGASRRLVLGSAGVLSAEQARAAAKKVLAKVALGEDPQADRADRRGKDRLSLKPLIDEYLAAKERRVRPRTMRELRRYLTGPYFRPLHGMPVDTVGRRDIASRLVAIVREHGSIPAARARTALSSFFVWGMQMGLAESNPVIGTIQPEDAKARDRVLSDDELAAVWCACGDDTYSRCIRLLLLTGCRRQEVGGMCWSELDLEHGTWTIPAARSKNGRAHTLPLMPAMCAIIDRVPRMVGRDPLFCARGKGFGGWAAGKPGLDRRSGVTGWTHHDLRRTVATRMADIGVAPHIVEQILNHQSGHKAGPAGIYNRSSYEREVKAALGLWADHIHSLVAGGERRIVPFAVA
jgi:integrase